ncbi:ABC transporter substrate-binding protein [Lachnoclostridium sp. Marseille-P6806]|uniref:ABC transporter substrate-binding protein n=1 Tax=Lachnoclostridium sp. Marseille-P6806 TaxID=2364793 RepID=UPI00102F8F0A|nr:ABC transporter substrate-binding protein [Lachnoclostridium sp. Marseille-P6806]
MKRRTMAAVLAALMLMTGCGASGGQTADSGGAAGADTKEASDTAKAAKNSGDAPAQAIAERRARAEETGQYSKVAMVWCSFQGAPAGVSRVEQALNEKLREKLALEVEMTVMDISYRQNCRLMLSSGEKCDIFWANMLGYTSCVNDDYCMDLEENDLLSQYGQGILSQLRPEYINACRVGGKLYGLPPVKDFAIGPCAYCIGKEYLDQIGYDYESMYTEDDHETIHTDAATIDDIFARLHAGIPDIPVFAPGPNLVGQGMMVDELGGDDFGVLLNPDSLKVEDLFASDEFKTRISQIYDWNQKGYISKDALSDTQVSMNVRVKSGAAMCMMAQAKPGYINQISAECGRPMIVFQCEDNVLKSSGCASVIWNINQNCEDPVAAMQLMDALYTDPELSNLLIWGQEDVDYVLTEDGHIDFAEGVDVQNAEYFHQMNWQFPNQYIAHVWVGDDLDIGRKTEEFNDKAVRSKAMGFMFDNSAYATELTALTNVYEEYRDQLMYGFLDPEDGIPEMEQRLKAAGLDTYIAAKQAALDQWVEQNGVN